nr:MAG TPA: hypothetical protein [Caudoviricetes sp.]
MCCGKIHKNRADFLAHLMLYFSKWRALKTFC